MRDPAKRRVGRLLMAGGYVLALGACGSQGIIYGNSDCSTDAECRQGACVTQGKETRCAPTCEDQQECTADTQCTLARSADQSTIGACLPTDPAAQVPGSICHAGDECTTGICFEGLCAERCTECGPQQVCQQVNVEFEATAVPVSICRADAAPHPTDLGAFATPLSGSAEITVNIPVSTLSFALVLVDDQRLRVAVPSLIAPDGTVLIDVNDAVADLNPGGSFPGVTTVLVSNTDDPVGHVQAGDYRVRVGTYDPSDNMNLVPMAGELEHLLLVLEPIGQEGGLLDLRLHFSAGTGIDAGSAAQDAFVGSMLSEAARLFDSLANIRMSAGSFAAIGAEHDVVQDSDEIRDMLTAYSEPGPTGAAVNVILVKDISFTSGYSAGIPGPPGLYASPASGLVIEELSTGKDTGILLAHELGHFLGLRHTTELTGGRHDPILDTPECPGATAVTNCPDYTNLMFPAFPLDRTLELSAGQWNVLRSNPALYEVMRPDACPSADVVVDITDGGFATGNTQALRNQFSGSCGGAQAPERWHLLRR